MRKLLLKLKMRLKRRYLKSKVDDCFLFLDLAYPFSEVNQRLNLSCSSLTEFLKIVLGEGYVPLRKHLSDIKILKFIHWKESLNEKVNKTYIYEGIYPTILLIAYGFLLIIYTYLFLPSVTSMMSSLSTSNPMIVQMEVQLKIHWFLIAILFAILVLVIYLYRNKDLRVIMFLKLHHTKLYKPIKLIWTHHFVLYYKTFYQETIDTKSILDLIRNIDSPLPASWLSYHVNQSFLEGRHWELDYLDDFFVFRIQVCREFEEINKALDDFIFMSEQEINRYFNYFIKSMKGGISLCLIAMITLYYQTLYLPLTILQTL